MARQVELVREGSRVSQQDPRAPHDERNEEKVNQLVSWMLMIASVKDQLVHQAHVYAFAHTAQAGASRMKHRYATI